MQHSSTSWPNYRNQYYNPVYKIRALIQTLDAELATLSQRCAVTKLNISKPSFPKVDYVLGRSSAGVPYRVESDAQKSMSVLNDGKTASATPTRTLSSIYRSRVIEAFRNRRIFTVYGNYHTIRRALLNRGWLEKLTPNRYPKLQSLPEEVLLQHAKRGNDYEAVAISKIISHFPAFFIWQPKSHRDFHTDILPLRNRVRRGRNLDFSTKVGLIGCAEQQQWFHEKGVCGMSHPRFYRLGGSTEERMAFIEDFRQTQCRCLLKFLSENMHRLSELVDPDAGTVPISVVHFAVTNLKKHFDELDHRTLDDETVTNADREKVEWQQFIANSNEVIRNNAKIQANVALLEEVSKLSRLYLAKLEERRRDYKWDGYRNLWILKPGYQCRGLGIIIQGSIDEILQWATNNPQRRYIAQKYIERPLLIHKTKFDIRQYMLLSIGESTLSLWLYKDCYLRFSSQEFTIDDLRESIHLTNNSVQKRYKNKPNRDVRLPKNNMWSLEHFKVFLKHTNAPNNVWEERIYPGFKENLTAVVMASMEETEFVENTFELYGCDLMLDEDYNPILIEINSTPDLTPSTDVTARICPMALRDLIKVIVDLPCNPHAPTGNFERVYEVNYKFNREFDPEVGLDICGKRMTLFKPTNIVPKKAPRAPMLLHKTEQLIKVPLKRLRGPPPKSKAQTVNKGTEPKVLKSAAKEALAIRYTAPK
ncbi:PREDICTED: tubulin glycylase 3B isoform X1 [Rhagoletis zephyria]|uniref:tubulin glycylase 3B isoform X1 n=1 Tax=Rhagoletis zephyria TaxID=28612 RepID=UPI0008118204|nr:PREDICTED: tubulin glycylase 3B isoform X1 [Rhagoletis zephyria]